MVPDSSVAAAPVLAVTATALSLCLNLRALIMVRSKVLLPVPAWCVEKGGEIVHVNKR